MDGTRQYYAQCNEPGRERQVSIDFTHLGNVTTEENLKEQNSSRLKEPKNALIVTKQKQTAVDGLERRDKVGIEAGIMISIYNVGLTQGGLYKTEETISDSTASCNVDGQ